MPSTHRNGKFMLTLVGSYIIFIEWTRIELNKNGNNKTAHEHTIFCVIKSKRVKATTFNSLQLHNNVDHFVNKSLDIKDVYLNLVTALMKQSISQS